jgi:hypothetical protein
LGKIIDLSGMRFGFWTVIKRSNKKANEVYWICKCVYGIQKEVSSKSLRDGRSTNCGCKKRNEDLTGKRFGKLIVLEQVDNDKNRHIQYKCLCDCGKEKIVIGSFLLNGSIKSCGCYHNEIAVRIGMERKKYNKYDLESKEFGIGYTFKGEEFWFDKEDFDKIKDYCWYVGKDGYVYAYCCKNNKRKQIRMHKLVMNANENEDIDHIKHKKYDNRKSELRKVTQSQNNMNQKIRVDNSSGYKGVCWDNFNEKWLAYISKNNKRYNLGSFNNIEDAIAVRQREEEVLFGEYSYNNSMSNIGNN